MLGRLPAQASKETPDGTPFSFDREVKNLLAEARAIRPDDEVMKRMIASVEDRLKEKSRGGVNANGKTQFYGIDSLAKGRHYDNGFWFVNDCWVRVKIESIKKYPISYIPRALVEIRDDRNKVVTSGTCFSGRSFILDWNVGKNRRLYTIRVTNTGDTTLDVTVSHN